MGWGGVGAYSWFLLYHTRWGKAVPSAERICTQPPFGPYAASEGLQPAARSQCRNIPAVLCQYERVDKER